MRNEKGPRAACQGPERQALQAQQATRRACCGCLAGPSLQPGSMRAGAWHEQCWGCTVCKGKWLQVKWSAQGPPPAERSAQEEGGDGCEVGDPQQQKFAVKNCRECDLSIGDVHALHVSRLPYLPLKPNLGAKKLGLEPKWPLNLEMCEHITCDCQFTSISRAAGFTIETAEHNKWGNQRH